MRCPDISIWGDSIAKGVVYDETRERYVICRENCVARLVQECGYAMENHSVMGHTTEQGLTRMCAESMKPGALAVIEFGGNDCDLDWNAVNEQPEVRQMGRVPLERFGENLREMVRRVRGGKMIPVLVTPPPLVAKRYFEWVSRKLDPSRILSYLGDVEHIYRWQERYALMIRQIAKLEDVLLLDMRDLFLSQDHFTDMMCVDGIHPNEKGHELLFQAFSKRLAAMA